MRSFVNEYNPFNLLPELSNIKVKQLIEGWALKWDYIMLNISQNVQAHFINSKDARLVGCEL